MKLHLVQCMYEKCKLSPIAKIIHPDRILYFCIEHFDVIEKVYDMEKVESTDVDAYKIIPFESENRYRSQNLPVGDNM